MPIVVNLDAVIIETITVNVKMPDETVREFVLKDDIPDVVGLMVFQLAQNERKLEDPEGGMSTERWKLFTDEALQILGEIWRHSYPDMTNDWLQSNLSPKQRMDLIRLFFPALTKRFSAQATVSGLPTTLPNRAAKRAAKQH